MEQTPLFVKIDKYKELNKTLTTVDEKVKEAGALLDQLRKLKEDEDAQMEAWTAALDDVKARSRELHGALFSKQG